MVKEDLVRAVARQIDSATQKDVKVVLETLFETIIAEVANGEKISLTGFGTFETAERGERVLKNPISGEPINVAACKTPKFRPSAKFKTAVNE